MSFPFSSSTPAPAAPNCNAETKPSSTPLVAASDKNAGTTNRRPKVPSLFARRHDFDSSFADIRSKSVEFFEEDQKEEDDDNDAGTWTRSPEAWAAAKAVMHPSRRKSAKTP